MENNQKNLTYRGSDALKVLAETYQQLYLRPGENSAEAYKNIVLRGANAPEKDLSHFITSGSDSLVYETTPAGEVPVLTLHERADFELFLQIVANRCMPYDIPATQGASILDGLTNWQKINQHKAEFFEQSMRDGNPFPDWGAEFRRFTSDKRNFKDVLIVLSTGPYSNISADVLGFSDEEWIEHSHAIRKAHECTHFICRRLYPKKIDAVWDELVADAVGIYAAFGRFDLKTEEIFLGISDGRYTGGRLQNYDCGGLTLDELAEKVHKVLLSFCDIFAMHNGAIPYEAAVALEEQKENLWK